MLYKCILRPKNIIIMGMKIFKGVLPYMGMVLTIQGGGEGGVL